MWPWGHLAVGYLLYATYTRYRHLEPPAGAAVVWLAIGTQFPDVVDKPIAYWTPLLPGGRALAHSLLVVVPALAAVGYLGYRFGRRRSAVAFVLGYASHVLADGLRPALAGDAEKLTFLLWPALPIPEYAASDFSYHAGELAATVRGADPTWLFTPWSDYFVAQLWLTVVAIGLWVLHGAPPLASFRRRLRQRFGTANGRR